MTERPPRHRFFLRLSAFALTFLALAASGIAGAQEIPPAPTRWVTDPAGFLSAETRDRLDAQLESYEHSSGHQLLVWIGSTVEGGAVEDFTIKTFTAWRVGRKGIDDGLVLFVFATDRKVRVEVGYGLEGLVPDITANRIIQDRILPKIRAGDHDGAITDGVAGLTEVIEKGAVPGEFAAPSGREGADRAEPADQPMSLGQKILYTLLAIGILIFVITNPGLAFWLLLQILSGSGGGRGGGGGGGGWSGGGGRGGGGGATGSW
ncbi:MAG TPA: TPM domain-containing protein [Thermoanaerobaculia bacterium]|jgi:uncharacterized protein|nr:TPM domain-containing protein [Thermoanaerobaculia bacterium]